MISETRKKLVIMGLPGAYLIFRALPNIAFHPSPKRKAVGSNPAGNVFQRAGTEKSVPAFLISQDDFRGSGSTQAFVALITRTGR